MQKIVDLYRGEQGTCRVLLVRTAMLTHSSPGIWRAKMKGFWRATLELCVCLYLVCRSREKAAILQQEQSNSAGSTPPGPLRACGSRGCSQRQDSRCRGGHKRLFESHAEPSRPRWAPAPARCWSETLSKYKTRHCFHSGTATHPQDCSRVCLCASSAFQMHSQRVVASLSSALSTWAAQARNC